MAGDDSPTEKKDEFHFGRSTPPPTTSHVATSKHDNIEIKSAAEPPREDKDKDKDNNKDNKDKEKESDGKDEIDVLRPEANPGYNPDEIRRRDDDDAKNREKRSGGDRDRNDGDKSVKKDALDGQWIPPKDAKEQYPEEEEEDDNCTVKCLYYTMQCCECSIS